MNSKVLIRAARAEEAAALSALAFRSKAHWGYSREFMEACREELTWTQDDLASSAFHFQVAESSEGELAGFYAVEKQKDGDFELDALFVLPEHIGTGIGRELMAHAIEQAAHQGGRRLVIQSDPNAEAFYRSAGGEVVGRRASASIPGRELPILHITLPRKSE